MSAEVRGICRKVYRETVESAEIPSELKRSLNAHERVPVFMDNLARELGRLPMKVKRESVEQAARDMTRVFIQSVMIQAEQRAMSPLQKAALLVQEANVKNMRALVDRYEKEGKHETKTDSKGNETSRSVVRIE